MFPFNYSIRILFSILKEWEYLQMYFYAITEHYLYPLIFVSSLTLKNHHSSMIVGRLFLWTLKNHYYDYWTFAYSFKESIIMIIWYWFKDIDIWYISMDCKKKLHDYWTFVKNYGCEVIEYHIIYKRTYTLYNINRIKYETLCTRKLRSENIKLFY